jgi:hypothetical protein
MNRGCPLSSPLSPRARLRLQAALEAPSSTAGSVQGSPHPEQLVAAPPLPPLPATPPQVLPASAATGSPRRESSQTDSGLLADVLPLLSPASGGYRSQPFRAHIRVTGKNN